MHLADGLVAHADHLTDQAVERHMSAHLAHYEADGHEATRERLAALLHQVAEGVRHGSLLEMIAHAEQVAEERYHAGYLLHEVQASFNTVEQTVWHHLVEHTPPHELADALGRVGAVIGAGKDRVAQTYVRLATDHHSPALDVKALFAGVS